MDLLHLEYKNIFFYPTHFSTPNGVEKYIFLPHSFSYSKWSRKIYFSTSRVKVLQMSSNFFDKISFCWPLLRPRLFLNVALWLTKYYVNQQLKLKLVDPILLGGNSVFWVPSGMNLIRRYALLHLASLGFRNRLRSVSNSSPQGPKKLNFPPR